MLGTGTNARLSKECWKSRISYIAADDVIAIEHFSETGHLLSEVKMNYEDALNYAKLIYDVCDKALGIE